MSVQTPEMADLLNRLGVPAFRIVMQPAPGTATIQDMLDLEAHQDRLCELIGGVLVERVPSFVASVLAVALALRVVGWVRERDLGAVTGAKCPMEILPGVVRLPDLAFASQESFPFEWLPSDPVSRFAPDLVADVLRPGNTRGEMIVKREHYFKAGVRLAWEIDPVARTVIVFTSPTRRRTLAVGDTLEGAPALPGFTLPLADLFAELDRHG